LSLLDLHLNIDIDIDTHIELNIDSCDQQIIDERNSKAENTEWKTIGGQLSGLFGKPYDFYKQIDVADFLK